MNNQLLLPIITYHNKKNIFRKICDNQLLTAIVT